MGNTLKVTDAFIKAKLVLQDDELEKLKTKIHGHLQKDSQQDSSRHKLRDMRNRSLAHMRNSRKEL